jgi:hypothetical protein
MLEMERAMGIEPTRAARSELENKWFGAMANPKCDGRVNFRGLWGHVGIPRRAKYRVQAYLAQVPCQAVRSTSTRLQKRPCVRNNNENVRQTLVFGAPRVRTGVVFSQRAGLARARVQTRARARSGNEDVAAV